MNDAVLMYPFTSSDSPAFVCKCGTRLRKANAHDRYYKVSTMDENEILSTKQHICVRDKGKRK